MKDRFPIIALLGLGAIVLIIYLLRQKSSPASVSASTPVAAGASPLPSYPAPAPIKLGDITINSPIDISNAPPPTSGISGNNGGCDCEATDCNTSSTLSPQPLSYVSSHQVTPEAMTAQAKNLQSFLQSKRQPVSVRPIALQDAAGALI